MPMPLLTAAVALASTQSVGEPESLAEAIAPLRDGRSGGGASGAIYISLYPNAGCGELPPRVSTKMFRARQRGWLPAQAQIFLDGLEEVSMSTFGHDDYAAALRHVEVGGAVFAVEGGTSTFLQLGDAIDHDRPSQLFVADCPALMGAFAAKPVRLTGRQVRRLVRNAVGARTTKVALRAHIFSPVAAALEQRWAMDPSERLSTLHGVFDSLVGAQPATEMSFIRSTEIVALWQNATGPWSGTGSTGSEPRPFASEVESANGRLIASRSVVVEDWVVWSNDDEVDVATVTASEVADIFDEAVTSLEPVVTTVGKETVVELRIPAAMCTEDWSVVSDGGTASPARLVDVRHVDDHCLMRLRPPASDAAMPWSLRFPSVLGRHVTLPLESGGQRAASDPR